MPVLISALMGVFLFAGSTGGNTPIVAPSLPSFSVHLTGYNAVPEQTKPDPTYTASGAWSNPEIIAARSRDLAEELPFGTIVAIDGPSERSNNCGYKVVAPLIGYRVIADSMNVHIKNDVDVLFDTKANYVLTDGREVNASTLLGSCDNVTVRVVGFVDINHIPKTEKALAALVEGPGAIAINK